MSRLIILSWFLAGFAYANIQTPGLSDRTYRSLTLENQIKVLLISDPTTDRAAASLDVYVGSNNDPDEFPGLAHFLEHMLFLGTDRFPEAGEYQQYISTQGGNHNAFTAPEHTNYFFNVDPNGLKGALDRFSRFFIAPTLDPNYVDREVNAVHSEYQSKIKDEAFKSFEATKKGLNPAHPFATFHTGNLETLNKPGLLEALETFYQSEYSADRMSLVVLGVESLDMLESIVRSRFKDISNKQLGQGYVSIPLFEQARLPLVVQSKPSSESRRIALLFPIPDTDAFSGQGPLRYIGHLLGHEGKGSLVDHLKSNGLANSLSAGESLSMTEGRSFSVSVSLTPKGFSERDRIIAEIFKTLRRIETEGIAQWRFEELKTITETNFRFAEESNAQNVVTQLSTRLHTIPANELFTRGRLLTTFDGPLIKDFLSWLVPENLLLRVTAPEVIPNEVTRYYPTEISVFPLKGERLNVFNKARSTTSEIAIMPGKNPFIRDPAKPLPKTQVATLDTLPRLVLNKKSAIGFVLPESRFSQPSTDLYIRLRTPLASDSPEAQLMADLLAEAINEHFNASSYNAALAGVGFFAQSTLSGITLQFSGYHESLILLLNQVIDDLPIPPIDEQVWNRLEQLKSQEFDSLKSTRPFTRLFDELSAGLMPLKYSKSELKEVFSTIDRPTFHQYQKAFFSELRAELFLHGPVDKESGQAILESIVSRLPLSSQAEDVLIKTQAWAGALKRSYQFSHPDQATIVAYVDLNESAKARVYNQLAGSLIEAPFYTHLRTEQQLGYNTFSSAFPLFNTPVLAGVIQSSVADPDALETAIQLEFNEFADNVKNMPAEQFEQAKQSLLNNLLNPPKTQSELSSAIWQAIGLRRAFNDRSMKANILEKLNRPQFTEYLRERVQNPIVLKAFHKDQ